MGRRSLVTVAVGLAIGLTVLYGVWASDHLEFDRAIKVCQTTGDYDKHFQADTVRKNFQHGVTGSDFGYPVPFMGELYFFFGDTRSIHSDDLDTARYKYDLYQGHDSVARAPMTVDVEQTGCVPLEFLEYPHTECSVSFQRFRPIRLLQITPTAIPSDPPPDLPCTPSPPKAIEFNTLGAFETPVSGFARRNELFVFFSVRIPQGDGCPRKDGCALGDDTDKRTGAVIAEKGGRTKLAKAYGSVSELKFTETAVVSDAKFQWPVAVVADRREIGLPPQAAGEDLGDKVVLIWGSGREKYFFRRGYPFLAVAPLEKVETMNSWRYFAGLGPTGPVLLPGEHQAVPLPPFGDEQPTKPGEPPYHRCVGEFSVAYIDSLKKWLMMYACDNSGDRERYTAEVYANIGYHPQNERGINVRTADRPWGPWSRPRRIFDPGVSPGDKGYCYFMHNPETEWTCPAGAPNARDLERVARDPYTQAPKVKSNAPGQCSGANQADCDLPYGGEYAPLLVPSYAKVKGDATTLYFMMSTWNPYQVVLMRTRAIPWRSYVFEEVRSALQRGWAWTRGADSPRK